MLPLLLIFCLAGSAIADTVILKNGSRFNGRVVDEDETTLTLQLPYGRLTFRRREIKEIIRTDPEVNLDTELHQHLARGEFHLATRTAGELSRLAPESERDGVLAAWLLVIAKHQIENWQLEAAAANLLQIAELAPDTPGLAAARAKLLQANAQVGDSLELGRRCMARQDPLFEPARAEALLAPLLDTDLGIGGLLRSTWAGAVAYRAGSMLESRLDEALPLLDEALAWAPDAGPAVTRVYVVARVMAAYQAFGAQQATVAMDHVALAIECDPLSREARFVRGQLLQSSGDFARAITDYLFVLGETSATVEPALEPCEALRVRCAEQVSFSFNLDDIVSALPAKKFARDAAMVTEQRGDLIVHAPDAELASMAIQALIEQRSRLPEVLGLERSPGIFTKPLEVFIHPTAEDYLEATQQHSYFSGVTLFTTTTGGKLVSQQTHTYATAPELKGSVLPHELAHAVACAYRGYGEDMPLWLNEGIAIQAEPKFSHASRLKALLRAVAAGDQIDLELLMLSKQYPSTIEETTIYYAESFSLVLYMRSRFGDRAFWRFAREVGDDLPRAWERAFGESLDFAALSRNWQAWLKR